MKKLWIKEHLDLASYQSFKGEYLITGGVLYSDSNLEPPNYARGFPDLKPALLEIHVNA